MEIKIVLRSRRLRLKFQIDSMRFYYNCYLCGEKGGSRNKNAKIDEPEQRRSEIFEDTIQDLLCKLGIKPVDINILSLYDQTYQNQAWCRQKLGTFLENRRIQ